MIHRIVAFCGIFGAAACGVIYTSPGVVEIAAGSEQAAASGVTVGIVPLSVVSVAEANANRARSRALPASFEPSAVQAGYRRFGVGGGGAAPVFPTQQPRSVGGPTRLPPAIAPEPYRIGVSDEISIGARAPDALTVISGREVFSVQDNGSVAIPGVGQVPVAGLTLDEARERVLQAFVERGLDPSFSFEVTAFRSQRVIVAGAVTSPAAVPITFTPLTLAEALQQAGGVPFEDLDEARVEISRAGAVFGMPAREAFGSPAGDSILRDGDIVFVDVGVSEAERQRALSEALALRQIESDQARLRADLARIDAEAARFESERANALQQNFLRRLELGAEKRDYAYLTGEIDGPQRIALPYEGSATLADVLYNNTGRGIRIFTADMSEIYVVRASDADARDITAYHLDASNPATLALATRFEMQDKDVVFVAEQPVTAFNRVLNQLFPSITAFTINQFAN